MTREENQGVSWRGGGGWPLRDADGAGGRGLRTAQPVEEMVDLRTDLGKSSFGGAAGARVSWVQERAGWKLKRLSLDHSFEAICCKREGNKGKSEGEKAQEVFASSNVGETPACQLMGMVQWRRKHG